MNSENMLCIGIDWADAKHDFHLIRDDGKSITGIFQQSPKAIQAQVEAWRGQCPGAKFAVAIETTKGALINALIEYEDIVIYPINPASLANYRKAFAHGGGKNDIVDARLLAQFLTNHRDSLRPLKRDSELTRLLATMSEDRRRLVDRRADATNQLTALLKTYFPAALELKPARGYSEFFLKFLLKYPTLEQAQKASASRLKNFFHGVRMKSKAADYVESLHGAKPLTKDATTLTTSVIRMKAIAEQLQLMNKYVKQYERELERLVPTHSSYEFVSSLPGASTNTHARLIGALGDDRTRYSSAIDLQTATGIAPVTTASGKMKYVSSRWACSKFLRQTFHEYAGLSIKASRWAKAYYDDQLSKGKSKNTAKRALAYKWQRIIFRLWQTGERYDEARYVDGLKKSGSPLYAKLVPQDSAELKACP